MIRITSPAGRHKIRACNTVIAAAITVFSLTGCEEHIEVRGNVPHAEDLEKIRKGFHRKSDIENLLGTPSAVATFEKETWYYIGGRVKMVSFFKPEVLARKVIVVKFNKAGVVDFVEAKDAPKDSDIELVERETPTKGKDLTVIQQLLGNVGRFSVKDDDGLP